MAKAADKSKKNAELALIDPVYQKFAKSVVRSVGSTEFYEFFMDSLSRSETFIQFSNRRVEKIVDQSWVDALEDALEGFQNIISSPRNVIKEDELIVNVANAKKAGSDVVRHLSTHAAYVEDYNHNTGDVRPNRLMQKYREDSWGIYENRLVFTTLEASFHFVKIRHDALFEAMGDEYGAKLKLESDMASATEAVHMDMFMHIKDIDSALETDSKNADVFNRISRIYRILAVHMNSQFAQQMSKLPRITGSISKTNVLKKNPNYRVIVKLLEFLRGYDQIGYTIKVIEQNPEVDEKFQMDIFHNILFNYLVLKGHLERDKDRALPVKPKGAKRQQLKPKFIKEIIEELTDDYDLPDVEIRKVLIEELTKEQLMHEEAEERRRLVEEQARKKKEEAERLKREKAAEKERLKKEKEAEKERLRKEKEAEEHRLLVQRMEREQEDRRRTSLFKKDIAYFLENIRDQLETRNKEPEEPVYISYEEFEDAAFIAEATDRLRREEIERERQRRRDEMERQKREEMEKARLAAIAEAERIAEEKRLEAERLEKIRIAELERLEKERIEEEARLAEERRIAEEKRLKEQQARDAVSIRPYAEELERFSHLLAQRMAMRRRVESEASESRVLSGLDHKSSADKRTQYRK